MTLKGLLTLLTQRPEFRRLVQRLEDAEGLPALTGVTEAARPYVIAALASALKQPLLVIVASETQASLVADTLRRWHSSLKMWCICLIAMRCRMSG